MKLLQKTPEEYMAEYKEFADTHANQADGDAFERRMAIESFFRDGRNLMHAFISPFCAIVMLSVFLFADTYFSEDIISIYPNHEFIMAFIKYAMPFGGLSLLVMTVFYVRDGMEQAAEGAAFYRRSVDNGDYEKYTLGGQQGK